MLLHTVILYESVAAVHRKSYLFDLAVIFSVPIEGTNNIVLAHCRCVSRAVNLVVYASPLYA
jgi:hypothetical protein